MVCFSIIIIIIMRDMRFSLPHFLDGELVDKLLERSGCPSAVSSISEIRKAISRKPIYSDIFNEEQRTSVEQHWNKIKKSWAEMKSMING